MAPSATTDEQASTQFPILSKGSSIKASVLHGPQDLRLEVRHISDPGPGELQIAIKSTGICGSDVSYYTKFANGDLQAVHPLTLGHESSGIVVAIGPQAVGFNLGDRVALEVGIPCSQCSICREGRYNLCRQMRFRSSAKSVPHFQGTLQERVNHPAAWCHRLPEHISFDTAALLEPLSVGIHAVNRACPSPGSTALVMGAGTIGLLTAAMVRRSGCSTVTIADLDAGRVEYALKRGFATHGYVVPSPGHASSSCGSSFTTGTSVSMSGASTPPDGAVTPASLASSSFSSTAIHRQLEESKALASEILSQTHTRSSSTGTHNFIDNEEDEGVDVTFECTGKEPCMRTALYATRPGGKVIMIGMGTAIQTLPVSAAHLREVDILGVFRYANAYPTGIRLLRAPAQEGVGFNLVDLDDIVTHRFKGLESAREAFELASRTADDQGRLVLKIVIEI